MDFELIKERLQQLNNKIKEGNYKLETIKEILPLEKPFDEIERDLKSMGLSMEDFLYTGFEVFPYRFYRDVTLIDMFSLSKQEIISYQMTERANKQTEHVLSLLMEDKFDKFFSFLDKRLKLDAYKVFYEDIPSIERYDIFRFIYSQIEYGFKTEKEFMKNCFKDRFNSQEWNKGILNLYLQINGQKSLTIYRGEGTKSTHWEDAFSWTLDKSVAKFFANRFDSEGKIYKTTVEFEDVVDYFDHRGEREIIVESENLNKVERIK